MSTEENKAIVRRWFDASNKQDQAAMDEVCTTDYIHHDPNLPVPDADLPTFKDIIFGGFHTAFPDMKISAEIQAAEGDRVCSQWVIRGTHTGEMPGEPPLPATGKSVEVTAQSIHRIADGKIAEAWVNFDSMGMMQQLGVVPGPGSDN